MGVVLQGSKKHYCVHPVSTSPNLEEECEKMLGDRGCHFYLGVPQLLGLHSTTLRVRTWAYLLTNVHTLAGVCLRPA